MQTRKGFFGCCFSGKARDAQTDTQTADSLNDALSRNYESTLKEKTDGHGAYVQEVFYATDRDFDANKKEYGRKQLIPLRYGEVDVRIPMVSGMDNSWDTVGDAQDC